MSNYTQATYFGPKDTLSVGDPLKRAKGTEIDAELLAISTAIATKQDSAGAATTGASGVVELATAAETATGTDATRAVTPAGLKEAYNVVFAQKSASTTVTASTTLIDDPHLVTPSLAVGTYEVDLALQVGYDADSTGGFKNAFGGTSTIRLTSGIDNASKMVMLQYASGDNLAIFDIGSHGVSGTANTPARSGAAWAIKAMLVLTAPGTINFRWAQFSANGATTLGEGSWMRVRRVA
jgi:hypothetical protein